MAGSREAFLDRVRRAVEAGNQAGSLTSVGPRGLIGYQGAGADPVACFRDAFTAAGGDIYLAENADAVRRKVVELALATSARRLLLGRGTVVEALGLEGTLGEHGLEVNVVDRLSDLSGRDVFFAADLGISGVDYLIAETGSLAIMAKPNEPRSLSLLPPVHIVIAEQSQLVPDLFDLFDRFGTTTGPAGMMDLPSCLSIITGPSKTGDIELKLVTGVHGPGEVHVILLTNGRREPAGAGAAPGDSPAS